MRVCKQLLKLSGCVVFIWWYPLSQPAQVLEKEFRRERKIEGEMGYLCFWRLVCPNIQLRVGVLIFSYWLCACQERIL